MGIDAAPDGRILVSVTAPFLQVTPPKPVLYATIADTTRQAREQIRLSTDGRLEAGKMEQVLIGETLARRGFLDYLEPLIRDPSSPVLARIVVVKGSAKDFLEKAIKWKNLPLPGSLPRKTARPGRSQQCHSRLQTSADSSSGTTRPAPIPSWPWPKPRRPGRMSWGRPCCGTIIWRASSTSMRRTC